MPRHLLALPNPTRVLAVTRRTVRAMRDRHTVRRPQAMEVVPLHSAGKALTYRRPRDIDGLTINEMIRQDLRTNIDHRVSADPKFHDLTLRLHLSFGEMPPHLLAGPLNLGGTNPKLQCRIAVALFVALRHDLAIVHLQHGDRNMNSVIREHSGHSELPCDQSTTHQIASSLELNLDIDTRRQVELHQRVHGLGCRVDDV